MRDDMMLDLPQRVSAGAVVLDLAGTLNMLSRSRVS